MKKRLILFKVPSYNRLLQLKMEGKFNAMIPKPPPPHLMSTKEIEMTPILPNPMVMNAM